MHTTKEQFDYPQFQARRDRLANLVLGAGLAWFVILFAIALGSDWSPALERFKQTRIWGGWTVDNALAIGALGFVALGVGGWWAMRHLRRPPQLFVILRDFQSPGAAALASDYVRSHGSKWGYWVTLENAQITAADSLGGEMEMAEPEQESREDDLPLGSWTVVSLGSALVLATMLLLQNLDSPWLEALRGWAGDLGFLGSVGFPVLILGVFCLAVLALAGLIRWLLLTVQRAFLLPGRITSLKARERVLETILTRVRRRATTLTLSPMPVIAVEDAWWKDAVERSVAEARLVIFFLAERTSDALDWEIAHVSKTMDPASTLFVKQTGDGIVLSDGTGADRPRVPPDQATGLIDAAVRDVLFAKAPQGP